MICDFYVKEPGCCICYNDANLVGVAPSPVAKYLVFYLLNRNLVRISA